MMENQSVAQKLEALVKLQSIDSKIDELKKLRGDLPDEVQDLEDELEGYRTRMSRFEGEQKEIEETFLQRAKEMGGDAVLIFPPVKSVEAPEGWRLYDTFLYEAVVVAYG